MEQKSNVQFRAEKEYKNSREKFFLLLREIISNSIHAVLIRQQKENEFIPSINLEILLDEDKCSIKLTDNGEGFTSDNSYYFEQLDKKNPEKEKYNFHPLGQGRLAIVYFSDSAEYETVYKDKNGNLKKKIVPYSNKTEGLFSLDLFNEENPTEKDSYTTLKISINRPNTFSRARTFFNAYPDVTSLKLWFIETFFPFIINNEQLVIDIRYNGGQKLINKNSIEAEVEVIPFELALLEGKKSNFKLWLIKKEEKLRGECPIICFARNLQAELSNGKLFYTIDNSEGYLFYLTSDLFDNYVDTKGERIEVSNATIVEISNKINEILDEKFKSAIVTNQKETKRNFESFKKQFPSLEPFIQETIITSGKKVINRDEMIKSAIDEKGKIEKKFWTYSDMDNEEGEGSIDDSIECQKLLNSSLHVYVKHRERVLKQLHSLIHKFDSDGNDKPELESTIHELFLKRGTTLKESANINHLHNLWILDDKFTIFSSNFKAQSTKTGQSLSDIYIWADDPEKTKQVLILELKSSTKAHNAGNHEEGMIAQVKRYAQDFYKNPTKVLNWDVDTNCIQFIGIILARKSDINKELTSNNVSGDFNRIPFLSNSFYKDEQFSKSSNPMDKVPIRIELYSYEDIYQLASDRNKVFFKLLKKEFDVNGQGE